MPLGGGAAGTGGSVGGQRPRRYPKRGGKVEGRSTFAKGKPKRVKSAGGAAGFMDAMRGAGKKTGAKRIRKRSKQRVTSPAKARNIG